ncbi:MAG: YabP/YqfC family sporulation protein [Clostridia bacterium]|nr:YabP/YqfC family sporulation protein [Clostridia bacterium]
MQKKTMGKIISEVFDIPLEGISNVPCAELIGNTMLNIDGCIGIKKYECDEIIIRTKSYLLKVKGEKLSMLTFSQGRVSIRGAISAYLIEEI